MNAHQSTLQSMSSALLIALVCWTMPLHSWAQEDEIIAGGKIKYQHYCATCHGATGKGNGEMAALMVFKPANLTDADLRGRISVGPASGVLFCAGLRWHGRPCATPT